MNCDARFLEPELRPAQMKKTCIGMEMIMRANMSSNMSFRNKNDF